MKKTFNRALSVILAVLMLASVMPMAFAAETLSSTNVTQWPTLSYKSADGKMYYGQTVSEALLINDDEIVLDADGNQVAGRFEFYNPTQIPSAKQNIKLNIKFVPDNTDEYTGFNKLFSSLTFNVEVVTPVFVDEVNDPVVATEVEAGATLSTSTLSGGKMTNPYNPQETEILNRTWEWSKPDTIVSESGYYEAKFIPAGYTVTTAQVYVKIAGEIPETTIQETPTIADFSYDPDLTWKDVKIEGGKAILKVEGTEVIGTFAVDEAYKDTTPTVGNHNLPVTFIPSDQEAALPYSFKIPVTVNKGTVKFVDESGEEIVPEITLPYGFKVGDDLNGYLKKYLNVSASFNYTETEDYGKLIAPGTHEYEVKTSSSDKNFEGTTLKFKVTVNQAELELKVKDVVGGKQIYIEGGDTYHLNGNFDVKYFIDGKEAGTIEGVKFNETFEVKQDKSGVYTYEIVYNEAENDPYKVTKVTAAADDIKLQHNVKVVGLEPVTYKYGDTVTINAPAHEKPYYEFTGWVNESGITLTDEQRSAESISTTMPDNDIELEATYKFNFSLFIKYIFDVICSWFAKIAAFITGAFAA